MPYHLTTKSVFYTVAYKCDYKCVDCSEVRSSGSHKFLNSVLMDQLSIDAHFDLCVYESLQNIVCFFYDFCFWMSLLK